MSTLSLRRRATVAACAVLLAGSAVAAQPASAGSLSFSKSSGRMATAEWLEVGTLPAPVLGNIHFGSMQIQELSGGNANVSGIVHDMTCPPGVIPAGPGGGHGEPAPDDGCVVEAVRFIDGGAVKFAMDRRLTKATLTGTLNVVGHDGGPAGRPPVNMTLTGVGALSSSEQRGTYSDGTSTYSYRYSFSGRAATITGNIGPMLFSDKPGEFSNGQLGTYRDASRSRTR